MSTENELELKIDAVITWVDGNDLNWQKKINKYLKVKKDFSKKKNLVRYNSIGEIDITIKSILKFAPFIKKIFLVTDNQKPQSFQEIKDIEVSVNEKIFVMIDNWKNAWMNQNFDQYIRYYSTNFKNNKGMDLEQWKQFRKPRVINKPSINLKLENIEISKNNNLFSVSFTQIYQSGNIDSTTKKTLLIELVDNQLKIVNEIS